MIIWRNGKWRSVVLEQCSRSLFDERLSTRTTTAHICFLVSFISMANNCCLYFSDSFFIICFFRFICCVQHSAASMLFEEQNQFEAAETRWSAVKDVLLRVPMFGLLLFFWFAFDVLAYGPNAFVTAINVLFCTACMFSSSQTLLLLPDFWSTFIY